MLAPYREPPEPTARAEDHEAAAAGALVFLVLLLSTLIAQYAPRNCSGDVAPQARVPRATAGVWRTAPAAGVHR